MKAEERLNRTLNALSLEVPSEVFNPARREIMTAFNEAVANEREACAEIAGLDSILDWSGGSTGNAKGTAIRIEKAIRARNQESE